MLSARLLFLYPLLAALSLFAAPAVAADSFGLKLPAGFEVSEYAGSELANDIYTLTIDPKGRIVVAGRGYIRILVDEDGDGKAERAIPFADGPKDGAMGMLWEGSWLYVTGDGGLRRYPVDTSGNRAAGPSELIRKMSTGGEHHAHAIRRGPDRWLYVLVGNTTGIGQSFANVATSPIVDPVAGCLLRFSPDLKQCEIVADGFRNPYDFDFNAAGDAFTFDSDNERCVGLPWYEPTRFYHVIAGGRHGWQAPQRGTFWRMPPYFVDVTAPLATLDRGSPTGCICYRHVQFPPKYRGGFFLADWTFGRIWLVSLQPGGSSYRAEKELFLQAGGENGFAPTGLAVHPSTGDLFVSIGGRGTRGAVYRIRYSQAGAMDASELSRLQPTIRSQGTLARLNAACRNRHQLEQKVVEELVRQTWDDPDRYVQQAAAHLLSTLPEPPKASTPNQRIVTGLACWQTNPNEALRHGIALLEQRDLASEQRLAGIRLIQLALGDIGADSAKGTYGEGYTTRSARLRPNVPALCSIFPTHQPILDREISRTLAVLRDSSAEAVKKVASQLTAMSSPLDDFHYLSVLAQLPASRDETLTRIIAGALLNLERKAVAAKLVRDRHWSLRLAEVHADLAKHDPNLNGVLLAHADFGRPEHALFAQAPGFPRRAAAELLLTRARKEPAFAWNAELVELMGELPASQSLPVLRKLWGEAGLEEAILPILARHADSIDRDKFLFGLRSPQPATLRTCLDALEKLPARSDDDLILSLVRVIRRLSDSKEEKLLRERISRLLARLTGYEQGGDAKAWSDWLTRTHPELAAKLGGADGVDVNAWKKRLANIDWSAGDAGRGQIVFTKASCAACHSSGQALGPDLRGVTSRFSRDDLLTAIIQPSRDVPGRYRTVAVETADGKLYQGLVVYEAPGSLILQTGPATTIRLIDTQIVGRGYSDISLMPAGTLDKVSDHDIADLLAYLRSLQ